MMRQTNRRPFDTGKTFTCRRELACDGETFGQGEVFPWRKLGVTEQRLLELWNSSYIEVAAPTPAKTLVKS